MLLDLSWRLWRHDGRKLRDSTYRPLSRIVHSAAWISFRNSVLAYNVIISQRTGSTGVAINFTRGKSEWSARSLYWSLVKQLCSATMPPQSPCFLGRRHKIEETILGEISHLLTVILLYETARGSATVCNACCRDLS
jgi:hypothetical protein